MGKKEPRAQKSKEQIIADLKSNEEFKRKMTFTREVFWPALQEASLSIEDAQNLLYGFNTTIMQEFLSFMKEKTIKDLKLEDKLSVMSDKYEANKHLLAIFNDLSVFEAKELIEGMKNEISLWISDEMRGRPLATLNSRWIDQI